MFAKTLITDTVPPVKTSDTALQVLDWMGEFKVGQLPVVNNEALLGMVSEVDLLEVEDQTAPIGSLALSTPENAFVFEDSHIYEALKHISLHKMDVLPVLSPRDNTYQGLITKQDLLGCISDMMGVKEPGGIIVLEVHPANYVVSEIGRIVESNDAKIISLTLSPSQDHSKMYVTLKLNIRELSRVIATFERFNYSLALVVFDADQLIDFKDRYENLLRYLNL